MPVTPEQISALERYSLNSDLVRQAFHQHWDENLDPSRIGGGDPNDRVFLNESLVLDALRREMTRAIALKAEELGMQRTDGYYF